MSMFHMTATRVDGHGIIALSNASVPELLFWAVRGMKERGWAGAVVRIVDDAGTETFNQVVPANLPPEEKETVQ